MKKISDTEINFRGIQLSLPTKVRDIFVYGDFVVVRVHPSSKDVNWGTKGDKERWGEKFNWEGGNVFCYDSTGVLVWQWPEKGISGMRLIDQGFIDEEKRSNNKNRENLIEKGYSEDEIIPKDYANPLFRPEGQVKLFNGYGIAHLVDIASGKELDRWETR